MGLYVTGMEMPTSCGKFKLFDTSHAIGLFSPLGWCRVNGKEIFRLSEKADFCPLVPVPEPHGRLIDADVLADSFEPSDFWNPDAEDNCFAAVRIVHSASTVIPASEDG